MNVEIGSLPAGQSTLLKFKVNKMPITLPVTFFYLPITAFSGVWLSNTPISLSWGVKGC
ncbi:hypothetical protein BDE36_1394 [Arcticibacter tournemirensis]|nr:hypothetical protein BDE36_1394 [Arcticibacter tournemirensis]